MIYIYREKKLTKNKAYNIQLSSWDSWLLYDFFNIGLKIWDDNAYFNFHISLFWLFDFQLYYTRKQDHAGIGIDISITNKLNFTAYTYDSRHWDDETDDWHKYD